MTAQNEPKGGRVIAGKFRLEWPIGRGGMGTVWAAMHLQLDMPVAVKFMDPSAADADGRQRFEREARAIAQLRSPNVVQVLDHGVDGGMPYIVMELLEGEDLESRLRRVKKLPLAVATRIFTQSAKALRRAHDAGIIHRDLKPNNVFLARVDDEEIVKLLDFGVAKMTWTGALDPHNESTQQGLLLGSPCYMSPEQARGNKNVDHRSDLWSLAVILFRSITGIRPFDAATIADLIIKICAEPPPVASQIDPELPPGLDDFFFRCFSHDPDQRYQSALEMANDFEALVRNFTPATETFTGGRIVNAAAPPMQRTATNPGIVLPGGPPQRTQSNPGIPIAPPMQRTATNPAMRAISMSGPLMPAVPVEPKQRVSYSSLPAYEPTPAQPSAAPQFAPPMPRASGGASPFTSSSPRLAYPVDPSVEKGLGSGIYPGSAQRPASPPSDPYAESFNAQGAPPGMSAPAPYMDDSGSPDFAGAPTGQSFLDPETGEAQAPLAEGELASQLQNPSGDVASMPVPDSTQAIGSTSNTLRERSPSGRQLVVWTTVAAMITAILVVAIFIVARSKQLGDGRGSSARPQGTSEIGAPQLSSQPQPTATAPRDQQAPPTSEPSIAPSGAAHEPPPYGGYPMGSQGSPSGSGSASAAPLDTNGVPFGIEDDAGAAPPPSTTPGPRQPWNPSGKKPKPNFGY